MGEALSIFGVGAATGLGAAIAVIMVIVLIAAAFSADY